MASRGGPRWMSYAGMLLVSAGLSMLGWVGWQVWGTSWQAEKVHRSLVQKADRQWDRGSAKPVRVEQGRVTGVVRIPAFGDDYAVPVLEGVSENVLAAGFGHVPDTGKVGEVGNYVLAGHRVTHGEPLRDMAELTPGALIVIETAKWEYTYELDTGGSELVVSFDADWVTEPVPQSPRPGGVQPNQGRGQRLITLTTCAELFHTDDRLVAFGHLTKKEPRTTLQ